eukprot:1402077-Rhodomonas_salina.1
MTYSLAVTGTLGGQRSGTCSGRRQSATSGASAPARQSLPARAPPSRYKSTPHSLPRAASSVLV